MDAKIIAGIIGFLAAIVATVITGYINHRLLMKKAAFDANLEREKNKQEKEDEQELHVRSLKEQTIKNLNLLSLKFSMANADITSDQSNPIEYHNDNFNNAYELLCDIKMVISLYFPKHKSHIKEIEKQASFYWGYYKQHLSSELKDYTSTESGFNKGLSASHQCTEKIAELNRLLGA